jgi:hypothetical protein
LPGTAATPFEFITNGRLGPTEQQFADALEATVSGETADLAGILGEDPRSEMNWILARAAVRGRRRAGGAHRRG